MDELEIIKEKVFQWPTSLNQVRLIKGVECVSWNDFTKEPLTLRLEGAEKVFNKKDIFGT